MTGGYGNGPDIINSCTVNVNKGEIVSILGPNIAFIAVDFPAPLGPRIETISPLLTFTVQELMISGPFPYPPVI
jgi:hypothetical protein